MPCDADPVHGEHAPVTPVVDLSWPVVLDRAAANAAGNFAHTWTVLDEHIPDGVYSYTGFVSVTNETDTVSPSGGGSTGITITSADVSYPSNRRDTQGDKLGVVVPAVSVPDNSAFPQVCQLDGIIWYRRGKGFTVTVNGASVEQNGVFEGLLVLTPFNDRRPVIARAGAPVIT